MGKYKNTVDAIVKIAKAEGPFGNARPSISILSYRFANISASQRFIKDSSPRYGVTVCGTVAILELYFI